jgi:hypothetical protein
VRHLAVTTAVFVSSTHVAAALRVHKMCHTIPPMKTLLIICLGLTGARCDYTFPLNECGLRHANQLIIIINRPGQLLSAPGVITLTGASCHDPEFDEPTLTITDIHPSSPPRSSPPPGSRISLAASSASSTEP